MKTKFLIVLLFFIINSSVYAQLTEAVDFTVVDTKNDTFQLFKLLDSGYFVLMDFGTLWCGACRLSVPALKNYWKKYHSNKGCFYVISFFIDQRETTGNVKGFMAHDTITYPVCAMDSNYYQLDDIWWHYTANQSIPAFVLISPDRTIPYMRFGSITGNSIAYVDSIIGSYLQDAVCYNLNTDDIKTMNNEVEIFPNPATTAITIQTQVSKNEQSVIIIQNILGEEILYTKIPNSQTIDISALQQGIYILQLRKENRIIATQKFIKQ